MADSTKKPVPAKSEVPVIPLCPGGCQNTGTVKKWRNLPNGQTAVERKLCPDEACRYRAEAKRKQALRGVPELAGAKSKREPPAQASPSGRPVRAQRKAS